MPVSDIQCHAGPCRSASQRLARGLTLAEEGVFEGIHHCSSAFIFVLLKKKQNKKQQRIAFRQCEFAIAFTGSRISSTLTVFEAPANLKGPHSVSTLFQQLAIRKSIWHANCMLGQMPKVMSCTGKQQFKTNKQNISFSQKICCWGVSRCLYIDNSTFFFSHGVPPGLACAARRAALHW